MRLTKPIAQHAVFRNAVKNAVGADDRGIDCASEDDGTHHHDERVENQPQQERPFKAHGQSADEVFQKALPDVVRNDHHGEERNQRREDHAVSENDQPGLFQID